MSGTTCVVRLVPLAVNRDQAKQCETLRQEAGRCWSDMVAAHVASRSGQWLSANDLMHEFKGDYALHSQSIQALAQKLEANVQGTRERRSNGDMDIEYPYRPKEHQTVTWKDQGIRVREGWIILSNGRGREPLVLFLPEEYRFADIRKAELLWRADHFELALTLDTGVSNPPLLRRVMTAGVDLGEVNIAAVVAEHGQGVVINGRYLRSVKRLRNKRHSAYAKKMKKCSPGSRRMRCLLRRKAQASARFERQARDILHKASRQVVQFAQAQGVAHLAVGDVREVAAGPHKGRHQNQRLSQSYRRHPHPSRLKSKEKIYAVNAKTREVSKDPARKPKGNGFAQSKNRFWRVRFADIGTRLDHQHAARSRARRAHSQYETQGQTVDPYFPG